MLKDYIYVLLLPTEYNDLIHQICETIRRMLVQSLEQVPIPFTCCQNYEKCSNRESINLKSLELQFQVTLL